MREVTTKKVQPGTTDVVRPRLVTAGDQTRSQNKEIVLPRATVPLAGFTPNGYARCSRKGGNLPAAPHPGAPRRRAMVVRVLAFAFRLRRTRPLAPIPWATACFPTFRAWLEPKNGAEDTH